MTTVKILKMAILALFSSQHHTISFHSLHSPILQTPPQTHRRTSHSNSYHHLNLPPLRAKKPPTTTIVADPQPSSIDHCPTHQVPNTLSPPLPIHTISTSSLVPPPLLFVYQPRSTTITNSATTSSAKSQLLDPFSISQMNKTCPNFKFPKLKNLYPMVLRIRLYIYNMYKHIYTPSFY